MAHLPRWAVAAVAGPVHRIALNPRRPLWWQRGITDAATRVGRVPRGASVERVTLGGRPAERVAFGASGDRRAVLYLHGGGYVIGSARMYRVLAAHLARATGAVVHTLDYRLAPEHPYPAALEDAVAAFGELVDSSGYEPGQIVIAGDSAGGGLAVATARALTDRGQRPAALVLLSPWTDPCDTDGAERDFVVNKAWGLACARLCRGDADPRDPGFAPLHGELAGLPSMLIQRCPDELLAGQIARFAAAVASAGGAATLQDLPRVWHSGQMLAGTLREATDSVSAIGAFLTDHWPVAASARGQ